MSGRAIGMFFGMGCGFRVGGKPTFVPAHIDAKGKKQSHRCDIPCYINSNRGTNENGERGTRSLFKLTVWGDLARKCALTMSQGKALDALVEIKAFKGRIFVNRQPVLDAAGQPLTKNQTGFTIMRMVFGEEAEGYGDKEVMASLRPAGWNDRNNPAYQQWRDILKQRLTMQYTGGAEFGYSEVFVPPGVQILPPEAAQAPVYQPAPAAAPAAVSASFQPAPVVNSMPAAGGGFTPVIPAAIPSIPTAAPATGAPNVQASQGFGV